MDFCYETIVLYEPGRIIHEHGKADNGVALIWPTIEHQVFFEFFITFARDYFLLAWIANSCFS